MSDKKKEIYIWEDLWGIGGIETLILNFISVAGEKYSFTLILVNKVTTMFDDKLKELGVNVYVLLDRSIDNPIFRFAKGLRAFAQYIKERKCEVIHFQVSHSIDFLYIEIAKRQGVPNRIAHCQNGDVNSESKRIIHKALKPFVQQAPTIRIGVSNKAAEWVYSRKYRKDWIILYNSIFLDQYIFDEKIRMIWRAKLGIEAEHVYLHIGRFNTQKNHNKLISIFHEIIQRQPDAILLLLGEGEKIEEVRRFVEQKGLTNNVRFLGTKEDVRPYYYAADELIFPSRYEGLSLVLVEAQASSLPCLVSDTCDSASRFLDCVDFLSLADDDKKWASKCIDMCGRKRIYSYDDMKGSQYDIRNYSKRIEVIYDGQN